MSAIIALAKKEARDLVRERTILAAVGIQAVIAAFSAFLAIGLGGLYDPASLQPASPMPVAYVGPGGFDQYLGSSASLQAVHTTRSDAIAGFREGRFVAVVEEGYDDPEGARTVALTVPEEEFQTALVVGELKARLREYQDDLRQERQDRLESTIVETQLDPPPARDPAFTHGALLPLLVLMPAMLSGAVTTDTFLQDRSTRTLQWLLAAPISPFGIVTGKMLVPIAIAPVQVAAWVLLLNANGIPIDDMGLVIGISLLFALVLVPLGVLIAAIVPVAGQAQATYALALIVAGVAGFLLPRNPLNLVAVTATGSFDAAALLTCAILLVVALGVTFGAVELARRRLVVADA